ncbi:MAG: hypothetical protein O3C67_08915 [Cyanobacteria bacterium]|nr:hypothetical protein [Cyanobacteriota bacterium]
MDLPAPFVASGLIDLHGRPLALSDWEHLFRWPGELLHGQPKAIATEKPDTLPAPAWDYSQVNLKSRRPEGRKPEKVPDISVRAIRERVQNLTPPPDPYSPQNSITRPNQSAGFYQAQHNGRAINPVLEEYPLPTLELQPLHGVLEDFPPDESGALWVCRWLCDDLLNGTQLLTPDLVSAWGGYNAGKVLRHYLEANIDALYLRRLLAWFRAHALGKALDESDRKLAHLEREVGQWAAAGRRPVYGPDGIPDRLLCAVNAVTALVGIARLADFGVWIQQWRESATACFEGLNDG